MTDTDDEIKCSELINSNLEEGEIVSDGEGLLDEEPPNKLRAGKINSDVVGSHFEFSTPTLVHDTENSSDIYAYSSHGDDWRIVPNANERHSTPYYSNHHDITQHTNVRYKKTKKVKRLYSPPNRDFRKSRRHSSSDPSDNEIKSKSYTRQQEMLCKFHVLGCCSKKHQCHFMHSDFPCKHYYLGLKGHDKSRCKLSHGKPLSNHLRSILLRHLQTASRDLLGDFPRYTTEKLVRKLDRQHKKLKLKYSGFVSPDSHNSLSESENISFSRSASTAADINDIMKLFSEVLRDDQVALLMLNGIDNIDKFSRLTMGQLSNFCISVKQVHKILQKPLVNMDASNVRNQSNTLSCQDVDMRLAALRNPTPLNRSYFIPKTVVQNENLKFDNGNAENQLDSGDESAELQIDESWDSPPRKESISNYEGTSDLGATESWDEITDQNTTCTDNQATDEDQQIVDSSNSFGGETSSSAILNQPTSDDSLFQTQNEYCVLSYNETDIGDLKPAEETNASCDQSPIPTTERTHTTLNTTMDYENTTANESEPQSLTIDEAPISSDILQPAGDSLHNTSESSEQSFQGTEITTEPINRISSMENIQKPLPLSTFKSNKPICGAIDYSEDYSDSLNLVIKDIELRTSNLPQIDNDLHLPFKRIQHSIADEIYASITSHPVIPYALLWEIDVPKPNFCSVRRSEIPLEGVRDPRLRRIFSTGKLPDRKMCAKLVDPRLKRPPDSLADITKKINQKIEIALLMSNWYSKLPQDQQVLANIQLDSLKLKLKNFHSDKTAGQKFDLSFVRKNILVQQVITNLGLNIDNEGYIQQKVCWEGNHTTYVFPSETRVMKLNSNYPAGSDGN